MSQTERDDWQQYSAAVRTIAAAFGATVDCHQKNNRLAVNFRSVGLNQEQLAALSVIENLVELVSEFPAGYLEKLEPPERITQLDDQAICDRCAALGLSIEHAQRLAAAANETDPQSLLRVLGLDFATLVPLKPRRWLWMVAQSSSVSYRRILTPETLLEILTTGDVPPIFLSHVLHVLDEASIQSVVMAVEQAAQESGIPIAVIWRNVAQISEKMQSHRNGAWTMNNKESRNK